MGRLSSKKAFASRVVSESHIALLQGLLRQVVVSVDAKSSKSDADEEGGGKETVEEEFISRAASRIQAFGSLDALR